MCGARLARLAAPDHRIICTAQGRIDTKELGSGRGVRRGLLPLGRAASLAFPNLGVGVLDIARPCACDGLRIARRSGRYSA